MTCLLSIAEMYAADAAAGVSGESLMEAAGWQVAAAIRRRFSPRAVHVLCGPGNNGGDGFVAARLLDRWGWPVRLSLLGDMTHLRGDAARMAARWRGAVSPLDPASLRDDELIVDALFGAGLSRPLQGRALKAVEEIVRRRLDLVAVDIPSGIDGNSGAVLGMAPMARLTVTFFRPKPGHLLQPGRLYCGELTVGDIGIPETVLDTISPRTFVNRPPLWWAHLPWPHIDGNKYDRGHLMVAAGGELVGAARFAAGAGRRSGAGLVSIVVPEAQLAAFQAGAAGIMARPMRVWPKLLADRRINAAVIGPGLGVGDETCRLVGGAIEAGKTCVLDADALSSFAGRGEALWRKGGNLVLTPHDGEYARLFRFAGSRLDRARLAAAASGAVVVLKGSDTVVAAPDGRAAICADAPPTLASGGTGDVLAGLIGGLLAQGLSGFDASCIGVWFHAAAAARVGPGLIAEDVIEAIPAVWRGLAGMDEKSERCRSPLERSGSVI